MGQRGPLPKPTRLRELQGNPRNRPMPDGEPEPPAMRKTPAAPAWMPEHARACWKRIADELRSVQMLHQLDLNTLELYAITYANWRKMVEEVKRVGYTKTFRGEGGEEKYSQVTPEATLASKYLTQLNQLSKVLGIGPAHRVGLHILSNEEAQTKEENPVMRLIHGDAGPPRKPKPQDKPAPRRSRSANKAAPAKRATKKAAPAKRAAKTKPTKKAATKKKSG